MLLLDPQRDRWQKPEDVIELIGIDSGDVIVDIGAGSGYFTHRFSKVVGPGGHVYATEINQMAVEYLEREKHKCHTNNLTIIYDPSGQNLSGIPKNSSNCVFFCDVHLLKPLHPSTRPPGSDQLRDITPEYLEALNTYYCGIHELLKHDGKLVHIEQRAEFDKSGNLSEEETVKFITGFGSGRLYELEKSYDILPLQYFLVFRKKLSGVGTAAPLAGGVESRQIEEAAGEREARFP